MNDFKKVVRIGTSKTYRGRAYSIYCEIEYKQGNLSITGVEGPTQGGNCLGSCGQIVMSYKTPESRYEIIPAPNWNRAKIKKFFDIWDEWHLNDMQSACEHQRALGWDYENHRGIWVEKFKPYPKDLIDEYATGEDGEYYTKWDKYQGHKCPTCGYSIGSAWLRKEIPENVLLWLRGLPVTDKTPAWV